MRKIIAVSCATLVALAIAYFVFFYNNGSSLPSKQKMVDILSDVYIIDAIGQSRGNLSTTNKDKDLYMENSYHTLLAKYDMNKIQFDSAIAWYSRHPNDYAEIYEKVVNNLTQREAIFKRIIDKRDSLQSRIRAIRDSITIQFLKFPTTYSIHIPRTENDTFPKDLAYNFKTKSLRGGYVKFSMNYIIPLRNKSTDTTFVQMLYHYNDTIVDTINVGLKKQLSMQNVEYTYQVSKTRKLQSIDLYLMKMDNMKDIIATFSNMKFTYVPYEVTDSIKVDEISFPPLFSY